MSKTFYRVCLSGLLALLGAAPVQAATDWTNSWNYGSCGSQTNSGQWGNAYTCTGSQADMNISAWSSDLQPVSNFQTAYVADYGSTSGYGVISREECSNAATPCNAGPGPHAADNYGNLDGFLLKFTDAGSAVNVALSSIKLGWNGTDNATTTGGVAYKDSDISVFYYTGTSAPSLTAVSSANLTTNGWNLLGNFSNVGNMSGNTVNLNNSTVMSGWWLVTALVRTSTSDNRYDAFKLLGAAGGGNNPTPPDKVPEPGSFALAVLALCGLLYSRRRLALSKQH